MYKYIFWDLDGTLTDSSEGITKCFKMALEHFGKNGYELQDLLCVIGPPLRYSFPKFGLTEQESEEALKVFRSRYNTVGKFENKPYDGIIDLLKRLQAEGYQNYVATSKPEETAIDICDKFGMTPCFREVCGATMDSSRDKKEKVIAYLLEKIADSQRRELEETEKNGQDQPDKQDQQNDIVMIGDTHFDVEGAAMLGIPTIGVNWGFGDRQEMLDAGAFCVVDTMEELYQAITSE